MRLKQLLGEIMIGMGFVTRQQVDEALQRQRKIFEEKTVPERLKRARLVSQARLAIDRFPLLGKILTDMGFATKEQLEEALKEQNKMVEVYKSLESEKLGTTIEIGFIVNSTLDLAQVLALIMGHANRVTNSIASTLMLLDDKTGELVFSVPTGPKGDRLTDIRLPSGKGIAGWVAEHEEPALVPDAREDPRFYPEIDKISGFETKSILCVPLKAKTKLIGVLEAINKADGTSFTEEDTLLLNIFAYQAAMAIENARLYGELKDRLEEQILMQKKLAENITDLKHAEDALKASQEYTRNIIDSSLDMIIAVDMNRRIVEFNKAAERTFGYRKEDVAGTVVDILYADPNEGLEVHKTAMDKGQCMREILNRRKNGEAFPSFLSASTLLDTHGDVQGVMGVSRDITEQKQAQDKLTASLKEKEVLLKEIHHRVKNNMQVISSMLSLQSQHITDKASRAMFQESQNRVRSMALIHEKLYQSEDMARIDIAAYIQDLTAFLFSTYTVSNEIKITIAFTDIFLAITTAIPCGLIINELVSNALKHAFPHQRDGTITVSMTPSNTDSLILTVSDTGIGFPEGIDFRNTTTLGMQLVTSLVEQLEGTITLDRSEGTRFRIEFRTQE